MIYGNEETQLERVRRVRSRSVRKLTVRVPDDVAETFAAFCAANGITAQSCLLASMIVANEGHNANNGAPIEAWQGDDALSRPRLRMLALAREMDASRRGRKPRA